MFSISQLTSSPLQPESSISSCVGSVLCAAGSELKVLLPYASIGDVCYIKRRPVRRQTGDIMAEIVGFDAHGARLAPFEELSGVSPGAIVTNTCQPLRFNFNDNLIGQVLNGIGQPQSIVYDGPRGYQLSISAPPPLAVSRKAIATPLQTGVRSIDALCTIGVGQRMGLMAGPGVGKSTLLGMIARNAAVDLSVIALVGERGREVQEFIDDCLGSEGLAKSVLVVSTSDEAPIMRATAVQTATSIAEHYRAQGKKVLLLVDSLSRTARALRDVALCAGELPIRQGFPASVFSALPKIVERAGNDGNGSITAIYTVLTNGEGESDPLSDEIKSLLDGHIILDQAVIAQGIRPAIDIPSSISRLFLRLHSTEYQSQAGKIKTALARLKRERDLLMFGATPDEQLARILAQESDLKNFLNQNYRDCEDLEVALAKVTAIAAKI